MIFRYNQLTKKNQNKLVKNQVNLQFALQVLCIVDLKWLLLKHRNISQKILITKIKGCLNKIKLIQKEIKQKEC
jgi:hypothetical protein